MNLQKIHEREVFTISTVEKNHEAQVHLEDLGYIFEDDFAYTKRTNKVSGWQSETLTTIEFLSDRRAVYPDEEEFDTLSISFLPASLPKEEWNIVLNHLVGLSERLQSEILYKKQEVSPQQIEILFQEWHNDIENETGDESGSETVAILTQLEYDKNRV